MRYCSSIYSLSMAYFSNNRQHSHASKHHQRFLQRFRQSQHHRSCLNKHVDKHMKAQDQKRLLSNQADQMGYLGEFHFHQCTQHEDHEIPTNRYASMLTP